MNKTDESIMEQKIGYLTYCHDTINRLKSSIYERASILVVVIAFIVPSCFTIIQDISKNISKNLFALKLIVAGISIIFCIFFLLAAYYGIKCLIPIKNREYLLKILNRSRNRIYNISINKLQDVDPNMSIQKFLTNQNVVDKNKVRVFTTFDHITDLNEDEFEEMVASLDNEKILEQLVSAIYNMSHIAKKRYTDLKLAYKFLLITVFIFIILIIISVVVKTV